MDLTSRKILTTGITGGLAIYLVSLVVTIILGKPSVVLIAIPPLLLLALLFGYFVKNLCETTQLNAQDDPFKSQDSNNPEGTV